MESPFEYNKFVTGSNFIGRTKEVGILCNLLKERSNILIYSQARTGKKSLVCNSLDKLKQESYHFTMCNINLFNIRCIEAMMLKYTNEIFTCFSSSATEWNMLLKKYAPSAPYVIDEMSHSKPKFTYSEKELLSDSQIEEIIKLPEYLANENNTHIIMYVEQFQDILLFDDPHRVFNLLEKGWKQHLKVNYIITGERYNAMCEIFEEKKYFYHFAEQIKIVPIDEKIFTDYIVKGFLKAGKVVQPDLALSIYGTVGGDPWYVQHLASICFDMTRGYLNDTIVEQAVWCLINLHDYQFHSIVYGLSKHQLRFIKAILEGVTKFSSADILDKYKLNSSANVNRLKDALTKKEIITFDDKKEAVFMDPLLKLWFQKYFFVK
ncbi:MAG: hypothetical protein RSC28_03730 [Bacteroidales bacterium]